MGPERRKITAEAFRAGADSAEVLSRSAASLNLPYMDQIRFLSKEAAAARVEIKSLLPLRGELADPRDEIASPQSPASGWNDKP
ncbi:MAG: hypothetical protein ACRDRX_01005 [Pseudonocardiaceae bacterium]